MPTTQQGKQFVWFGAIIIVNLLETFSDLLRPRQHKTSDQLTWPFHIEFIELLCRQNKLRGEDVTKQVQLYDRSVEPSRSVLQRRHERTR